MLMPHPVVLRGLVDEYEAAVLGERADDTGAPGPRTRDLAYTLCVSTGTRDVARALEAARRWLAAAPALTPTPVPVPVAEPAGVAD
ncbi:DUF5133 domain-containing protein [Streptomyces pactum]|uniref:DUF5133 domain-containing protein n=1 Tax=Streptomyces pactum TaxID=68249 RepID=A0A1S6JHH6_9ACTN|nr:DUF5133 domain-containing protein [Streptomyces pactum]AQS71200.1 DUF5133 domain-containing protein [Streptomyces pactum]